MKTVFRLISLIFVAIAMYTVFAYVPSTAAYTKGIFWAVMAIGSLQVSNLE